MEELFGTPADEVLATLTRYNEFCAAGSDDDFGKDPHYLAPYDQPPFYAGPAETCRYLYTHGGLDTDLQAQVQADRRSPHRRPLRRRHVHGQAPGDRHHLGQLAARRRGVRPHRRCQRGCCCVLGSRGLLRCGLGGGGAGGEAPALQLAHEVEQLLARVDAELGVGAPQVGLDRVLRDRWPGRRGSGRCGPRSTRPRSGPPWPRGQSARAAGRGRLGARARAQTRAWTAGCRAALRRAGPAAPATSGRGPGFGCRAVSWAHGAPCPRAGLRPSSTAPYSRHSESKSPHQRKGHEPRVAGSDGRSPQVDQPSDRPAAMESCATATGRPSTNSAGSLRAWASLTKSPSTAARRT